MSILSKLSRYSVFITRIKNLSNSRQTPVKRRYVDDSLQRRRSARASKNAAVNNNALGVYAIAIAHAPDDVTSRDMMRR